MKLSPLKGVLIHIIYWSCVAILTVISTAIGILESILYSKEAFMYLVRVFWSFLDPLPFYSKNTSLLEVRESSTNRYGFQQFLHSRKIEKTIIMLVSLDWPAQLKRPNSDEFRLNCLYMLAGKSKIAPRIQFLLVEGKVVFL